MGFTCGILGLSNVGKSTVFNALTATATAQASNYPFSTIEPNVGEVMVPDPRLDVLAKLAKSAKLKPTRLAFVDIAGLVSGASRGEGLGNQFLAHVREVDAILHVIRWPISRPSRPSSCSPTSTAWSGASRTSAARPRGATRRPRKRKTRSLSS